MSDPDPDEIRRSKNAEQRHNPTLEQLEATALKVITDKMTYWKRYPQTELAKIVNCCSQRCPNMTPLAAAKSQIYTGNYNLEAVKLEYEKKHFARERGFKAKAQEIIDTCNAYVRQYVERINVLETAAPKSTCETQTETTSADHETQTETKSYNDCASNTTPWDQTLLSKVGRLKFKLAYNRIWQRNYEKSIKRLLRSSMSLIIRAFAKYKPDTHRDDELRERVTIQKAEFDNELDQLKAKLEGIDRVLNETNAIRELKEASSKTEERVALIQNEINELRNETLELQINAAAEISSIKKSTHEMQAGLADIRQSNLDLKNGLHSTNLENAKITLSVLETALETKANVKEQFEKLPSFVTPQQLSDAIQTERDNHIQMLKGKSIYPDVPVTTYEYYELMAMVDRISKFEMTLPKLNAQADNVSLILDHQTAVLTEAKSLIKELKSITRSNLEDYVGLRQEEKDKRKLEVEEERWKTHQSHRKAQANVARRSLAGKKEIIKSELDHSIPRVVTFVNEWNSLKQGDIFLFKGLELRVDETFNPSLRIAHLGQDSDKWEAQKYANTNWYVKGINSLMR
jgi:archaellum component FlaC